MADICGSGFPPWKEFLFHCNLFDFSCVYKYVFMINTYLKIKDVRADQKRRDAPSFHLEAYGQLLRDHNQGS